MHTKPTIADSFIADVKNAVNELLKEPGKPVEGKVRIVLRLNCFFLSLSFFILTLTLILLKKKNRWHCMELPKLYLTDDSWVI